MIKKSSTENSSNNVRNVNYNGNCNNNNKNNTNGVVPVRDLVTMRHCLVLPNFFPLDEILTAYFSCRKYKRRTPNALEFEYHLIENILNLYYEINTGIYVPGSSTVFTITHPKPREVWAALFRDRIVHHLICRYLVNYYTPRFITGSYACIKDRGTLAASKALEKYIRQATNNWDRVVYIGKVDIRNFFVSISRDILWSIIKNDLDPSCVNSLGSMLIKQNIFYDPTDNPIVRPNCDFSIIPPHKSLYNAPKNRGLPIGNLTSQTYANVYLDGLDQYCKHVLKIHGYVRYVDDICFVAYSESQAQDWIDKIDAWLKENRDLSLHPDKTHIIPSTAKVTFVGRTIRPFHTEPRKMTIDSALAATDVLYHHQYRADVAPVNSYLGLLRHSKSYNLRKCICNKVMMPRVIWSDPDEYTKIFRIEDCILYNSWFLD